MTVRYELDGHVARITLDRADARNAFNRALFADLDTAMFRFRDDDQARIAIFAAEGPAFSVGFDIKDGDRAMSRSGDGSDGREFTSTYLADDMGGKPVIAAIHGHCVGQAVANALFCDIRVASDDAIFTLAEARVGISALALPQMLHDTIGASHARYMLLTGEPCSARWALRSGLVHEVVSRADLESRTSELADSMLTHAPLATRAHKLILRQAVTGGRDAVTASARRFRAETAASEDFREGRRAFIERRTPRWQAR